MKLTKTKTVMSIIYAIFFLFSVSTNAQESEIKTEETLFNPNLEWESKEIHKWYSGLRFINGESQIIYFADGYIYISDAESGEILVKSKQYKYHPGSKNNDFIKSFHLSADKSELYAYLNNEYLIKLNQETLEPIDTLFVGQFSYLSLLRKYNNIQFIIPQIDKEVFIEKITDNEIIFNLQAVSIGNSPTNDYEFYGRAIISFDRTNDTFELKDTNRWKILHYIPNTYASNDHIHLNNYFVYADKLISFYKDPNRRIFLTDKRNFKQYNTGITIIRNNSFDSEYTFSSTKNQKYILVTHNFFGVSNDNIVDSLKGYIYDIENKTVIKTIDYAKMCKEYNGIFYLMDNDFNHLYFSSVEFDSTKINYYYDLSDNQLKKSGILEEINDGPLRLENEEFTFVIKGFENGKIKRYKLNPKSSVNNDYAYPVLKTDSKNLFVPIENSIPKKITIFNNSGKEIQRITKDFKIIENYIILDIDALQSGFYLISLEFENNKTQNFKFIK